VTEGAVDLEARGEEIGAVRPCHPPVALVVGVPHQRHGVPELWTLVDVADGAFIVELTIGVVGVTQPADLVRVARQQVRMVPIPQSETVHRNVPSSSRLNIVIPSDSSVRLKPCSRAASSASSWLSV
jgi:hypothetical protein